MTYPFTPGIQSNLVYGIESTVEETRVENGVNVVTSQHDACRTYESRGAGTLGTPEYTTVRDHMTTTYSGRPPYLVSAAANHTHFPTSNNLSNLVNFTPYYTQQQMPMSYQLMPNNLAYQADFTPYFNTLPCSQMPYQPNQTFMQNNTPQISQPNQNYIIQNPNSPFCVPCMNHLADLLNLNDMNNSLQPTYPSPLNYNLFLVNQVHYLSDEQTDEPMATNDCGGDAGRPTYLSIEQPGGGLSTGTSTTGLDRKQPDPCASSPPSAWPEAGTQTDPHTGSKTEPEKKGCGTMTDDTQASGSKEAEIPRPETTEDIIASILNDILPCPDNDQGEKKQEKVSGNNGAKTDDDKNIRQDKETQVSGFETKALSLVNPSGRGIMRPMCGCPQLTNRKVTFGGVAHTSLWDFNQLEGELNKWYSELEEIERVFINQAEETIDRDTQIFTSWDELEALYETLRVEIGKTDYIERELKIVNANRQEMEALVAQLENHYNQFSGTESWVPSQRKYIYDLFLTCNIGLAEMRDNLAEMCDIVEEERGSIGPPEDPVRQIVRIISIHLHTLNGIDGKTSSLCSSIDEVSRMINQFKRRHGI